MPWTRKQVKTAQAVKHGFKPTGTAKGFGKSFASQVVSETGDGTIGSMIRKAKKGQK